MQLVSCVNLLPNKLNLKFYGFPDDQDYSKFINSYILGPKLTKLSPSNLAQ